MSHIANYTTAVYLEREAIFLRRRAICLFCPPSCRTAYLGIFFFATFCLVEMACLNEEDFLECLYSLHAVCKVGGSRKELPDILKRNVRLQLGEFMFRSK